MDEHYFIRDFEYRYRARVHTRSREMYNTYSTNRDFYNNYDYARNSLAAQRDRVVDIEMPEEAFKFLVRQDILAIEASEASETARKEQRIRDSNPSVAEAYSKYKMLLVLCQ